MARNGASLSQETNVVGSKRNHCASSSKQSLELSASGGIEDRENHQDPIPLNRAGSEMLGKWSVVKDFAQLAELCIQPEKKATSIVTEDLSIPISTIETEELNLLRRNLPIDSDPDVPFYFINLKRPLRRLAFWNSLFPDISPFYAVKCNSDPAILMTLSLAGVAFDCASIQEMASVLCTGASPDRIILANPCKSIDSILYARSCGVRYMTFDNSDELRKISKLYPTAKLILRIATDDEHHSKIPLSNKFGASLDSVESLVSYAQFLGLSIVGISFHVGSGCHHPEAYRNAIIDAYKVVNEICPSLKIELLDIGGGYPGKEDEVSNSLMHKISTIIKSSLDEFFPNRVYDGIRVVSEPGKFFVQTSHILCSAIVDRKVLQDSSTVCYTITEGVYGAFKDRVLVDESFQPTILHPNSQQGLKTGQMAMEACIIGPSGHDLDVVCPSLDNEFCDLAVGDWLAFNDIGAYTVSLSSCYFSHSLPNRIYSWV